MRETRRRAPAAFKGNPLRRCFPAKVNFKSDLFSEHYFSDCLDIRMKVYLYPVITFYDN